MRRVFGFDIGTTSIGWAVVEHDPEARSGQILGMGVRIFPEARDPEGTPLNQTRRQKRLMRRQLRRRRQRRKALNQLLAEFDLLPPFSVGKQTNRQYEKTPWDLVMEKEPLALRAKGLEEPLTRHELGRALYHLARLRHYRARDFDDGDVSDDDSAEHEEAKTGREVTVQSLKATGQTLGQLLAERAPSLGDRKAGRKGDIPTVRTRGIHALRSHVEAEFNRLLDEQSRYHPVLRDPAFVDRLRETIFAQKPVFWRKSTLGQCRFIPGAPLCPKGSWLSQQRRMLEKLNNLAIAGGNIRPLDSEERAAILDKLQVQESMTWGGVRSALKTLYAKRGEPGSEKALRFNLELGGESKLLGNAVEAKLARIFGASWAGHPHKQAIRDAIHERLWAADYGEVGSQRVVILDEANRRARRAAVAASLERDFGISPAQAAELAALKLPAGWEPYSAEALTIFLPRLEEGIRFGALISAPEWAEWREAHFPNREKPTGEIFDRLPSPADREEQKRQAAIRNPTVVRTQNELRKVVNNLIRAFGKPHIIRVEVARAVGLSKRERVEMQADLRKQEKRRREAAAGLIERGIAMPSRRDIEKWMLWKESRERCPYTGDCICFDALFKTGEYDVEHIWPRSRSLDDSFRNKTLCRRDVNIAKGNRTPFEYYGHDPDAWSAVTNRLQSMLAGKGSPGMPLAKVKRFLAQSIPEDFASRQLNDTGYAARQATAFLKRLWPDLGPEAPVTVQAVSGRVTAQLRKLWQLNNILSEDGEKTRADHRHHAIDALVVSCTDPGIINRLSRYWQQRESQGAERPELRAPWPNIRSEAERAVNHIVVSHRVRKKVSGPLHSDMPFGRTGEKCMKRGVEYDVYVKRMPVEKISLASLKISDVSEISRDAKVVVRDAGARRALAEHLEGAGGDPKKAYPPYPRLSPDGPEIRRVRVLSLQQSRLMVPTSFKSNEAGAREAVGYGDPSGNHHIAAYRRADGKIEYEVVSLYEAARRLARRHPVFRRDREGAEFVISLAPGEAVQFVDGERKGVWIVQGVQANGQVVLMRDRDAQATKEAKFRPRIAALLSRGVRKVSIDPIGRIRPAGD